MIQKLRIFFIWEQIYKKNSLGYRVVSASPEWMTPEYPSDTKIQALQRPILTESLQRRLGAGGSKTAGRRSKRRDTLLIKFYQKDKGGIKYCLQRQHSYLSGCQFFQHGSYLRLYARKIRHFHSSVNQHYEVTLLREKFLIQSVCLPNAAFQKISFYRPFEIALGNTGQYPVPSLLLL